MSIFKSVHYGGVPEVSSNSTFEGFWYCPTLRGVGKLI